MTPVMLLLAAAIVYNAPKEPDCRWYVCPREEIALNCRFAGEGSFEETKAFVLSKIGDAEVYVGTSCNLGKKK